MHASRSRPFHAALWGAAFAVSAQAAPLTAEEAVRIALSNNPALQADSLLIEEAEADLGGARRRLDQNPTLELEPGFRQAPDGSSADLVVSVRQGIAVGGRRPARIQMAEARLGGARLEVAGRRAELAEATLQAFVEAALARESARICGELVRADRELLDSARLRFEAGASTRLELNLARTEMARATRELREAEAEAGVALLGLRSLLGLRPEAPLELGPLDELPEALPPVEEALRETLGRRADLLGLRQAARLAEAEQRLFEAEAGPELELGLRAGREGGETLAGVSGGVTLPLFNERKAELQAAKVRQRRAEAAAAALEARIVSELTRALMRYRAARAALAGFQAETLPLLEENLALLQEAFQGGKVNFIEVLAVRKDLAEQKRLNLAALRGAHEAWIDWRAASASLYPAKETP